MLLFFCCFFYPGPLQATCFSCPCSNLFQKQENEAGCSPRFVKAQRKGWYQGLLELTGLLSGPLSLKCGGDTERDHSARDNETAERSPKAKVRLGYDVRDDWIYKYM